MLAARQQDPARLADGYQDITSLVLTIDGLPPEKGHETFDVVRELMRKRVWFAAPLLASAPQEGRRLIALARQWAERLDKPVRVWRSEKPEAFVKAIAAEFEGVPHRYGHNHFLRDAAQPVLEMDSRAQVKMRRKVRGLRAIERRVLEDRRPAAAPEPTPPAERSKTDETPQTDLPAVATPEACGGSDLGGDRTDSALDATGWAVPGEAGVADEAGEVVLGYCAAVRGMLNDDQGGPLHPPGVRMREAFQEGRESLERNLHAKKGGLQRRCCNVWPAAWTADALSHGRRWRTLASTPKPCTQWMGPSGRAPRPRARSVRRSSSHGNRHGSPARIPLSSIVPR